MLSALCWNTASMQTLVFLHELTMSIHAQALRAVAACRSVQLLTQSVEGRDGLLLAMERAVKDDPSLRLQLELLLRPAGPSTNSRKTREI